MSIEQYWAKAGYYKLTVRQLCLKTFGWWSQLFEQGSRLGGLPKVLTTSTTALAWCDGWFIVLIGAERLCFGFAVF